MRVLIWNSWLMGRGWFKLICTINIALPQPSQRQSIKSRVSSDSAAILRTVPNTVDVNETRFGVGGGAIPLGSVTRQ
jgi:hypothetical protein